MHFVSQPLHCTMNIIQQTPHNTFDPIQCVRLYIIHYTVEGVPSPAEVGPVCQGHTSAQPIRRSTIHPTRLEFSFEIAAFQPAISINAVSFLAYIVLKGILRDPKEC